VVDIMCNQQGVIKLSTLLRILGESTSNQVSCDSLWQ